MERGADLSERRDFHSLQERSIASTIHANSTNSRYFKPNEML